MQKRQIRVIRQGQHYNLFFIRPQEKVDAGKYAEKLASEDSVAEVMITEGECGFIVKARARQNSGALPFSRNSYKRITSYYQYKK